MSNSEMAVDSEAGEEPMASVFADSYPRLDYSGKKILAPMVKIGTLPTRLLALDFGADIVYTEEIIDFRLLRSERIVNSVLGTVDYVDRSDDTLVLRISPRERGHLVLQIGTCDPKRAARVAKIVERDVDGIDVNMGCPKAFSLKGGMGSALLAHPDKIKAILEALVEAVAIPITCKIRILPDLEKTLALVDVIQETGVSALAVHGRTKDERPNHDNHVDVIRAVAERVTKIPVIANGGSSNNRNSDENTYEGILKFWKASGASSVMVARAAEWNPSVFRPEGKVPIMDVIQKYMDYAIRYDYPFIICKYNVQQILGSAQESALGKKFLGTSVMEDLCLLFERTEEYLKRREYIRQQTASTAIVSTTYRFQPDAVVAPKVRRLSGGYVLSSKKEEGAENGEKKAEAETNNVHGGGGEDEKYALVTGMYCPYVRGHYKEGQHIPKNRLNQWTRDQEIDPPVYSTKQIDKTFRSVVVVAGKRFTSDSWEKNRKFAEQAAALVALHCLGIQKWAKASQAEA